MLQLTQTSSAMMALCHYEVLLSASGSPAINFNIYQSKQELEVAISGITEYLKELIQLKLAKCMPIVV